MKRAILTTVFAALLSTSMLAQTNIQWRGENRDGVFNETGLLKSWPADGPTMLWHYDNLGEGYASPAISGDRIYITGMRDNRAGYLSMFDLNGKLIKQVNYGQEWKGNYSGSRAAVTVDGAHLYLVSGMGVVYCYDSSNLNLVWKLDMTKQLDGVQIDYGINEAPLVIGGKLILTPGGKKNNIVAVNKNTGKLIWSTAGKGDESAYCSPIYVTDVDIPQIVTFTAKNALGINPDDGTVLWSYPFNNRWDIHANSPLYGSGMILCTSGDGTGSLMLKLDKSGKSVSQAWTSSNLGNGFSGIIKYGTNAYGYNEARHTWTCLDWNTGTVKFTARLAQSVPIVADGMFYLYTSTGELLLVKPDSAKLDIVSRTKVTLGEEQHWAHPVIYKGTLYVRHGNSLMAYKI